MQKPIDTLRKVLLPLSFLYGLIVFIRNKLYDGNVFQSTRFDIPVICVGNITVGGTGKTPHVEYLIREHKQKYNLAVLSRGYGRKTKGFRYVQADDSADQVGDEPLQMKQKFPDITFAVDEKRVRGIQELQSKGYNMVILDDAFQHRAVQPSKTIVLLDYNRLPHKDYYLPSGNLREGRCALQRADIVLITKCPTAITNLEKEDIIRKNKVKGSYFFTYFEYGDVASFDDKKMQGNLEGKTVLLVTGIANPKPLVAHLKASGASVQPLTYPDHYHFKQKDVQQIIRQFDALSADAKIILTTEKDRVKLQPLLATNSALMAMFYYLPIEVVVSS